MPSLIPGYEYDVFISYRQNDNRSGWVSSFVKHLREELAATIKDPVNIYFDENPHDGLLDTHHVDKSLEGKLKCLIFIPILSHTYCDLKGFAWNNEFLAFCELAKADRYGPDVRLDNGNVASRILPLQIHDLDPRDQKQFEEAVGSPLRSIEFIFRSPGVNRPLTESDARTDNLSKTFYKDQINKTANAIEGIISSMAMDGATGHHSLPKPEPAPAATGISWFWKELWRRKVFQASVSYLIVALLVLQGVTLLTPIFKIEEHYIIITTRILIIGFPLAMVLAWRYEVGPQGLVRINTPKSLANPYPPFKRKPLTSGPVIFLLLLSLTAMTWYIRAFIGSPVAPDDKLITIAVLPFENRNGNQDDRYIADGITDDIINRLAIISKFRVTPRASTQKYMGQLVDAEVITRELEVSVLVKGSLQRSGNQILVTAQLIDAQRDIYLWGDTFHRTMDNIISVQSDVAKKIAEQLKVKLNELEMSRLNQQATKDPTAYDYYLKGRSLYYKYQAASNDSAVTQFKHAIALDPEYARAWAGLGDAFAQMNGRFGKEYFWTDSGLLAGRKAIALDSNLSEGYKAVAVAYDYQKHYDQALPFLLKSVELSPTNEQAVGNLGTNYLVRGDLPNALVWEKKGVGLNPKNWIPYQLIGWIYRLLGDLSQAESWLSKSLELNPRYDTYELLGYTFVTQGRQQMALNLIPELLKIDANDTRVLETAGLIANFAGDTKSAEAYFQQSIDHNPNYKDDRNTFSPIALGQIRLNQGNRVEAEVYLSQAMNNFLEEEKAGSQSADLPYYIASIHAIRGNRDLALSWLQKAIDRNWIDYAQFLHGPYFIKYRTDPAFLEKVQLIQSAVDSMRKQAEGK